MSRGIYPQENAALPYLTVPGHPASNGMIRFVSNPNTPTINLSLLLNKGLVWWNGNDGPADSSDEAIRTNIVNSLPGLDQQQRQRRNNSIKRLTAKAEHLRAVHTLSKTGSGFPVTADFRKLFKRHFDIRTIFEWSLYFRASSACRLQIGARTNPLESGLLLHPLYGFPYIPGSALKGLTAAAYLHQNGLMDELIQIAEASKPTINLSRIPELIDKSPADLFSDEIISDLKHLFGIPRINKHHPGQKGGLVFLDAWPTILDNILDMDAWTVHYPLYYQKETTPPGDDQPPNPLPQLTVAGNIPFQFCIIGNFVGSLSDARKEELLIKAYDALAYGLEHLSIGAKPDYGFFHDFTF